jgi:hypothetical protein
MKKIDNMQNKWLLVSVILLLLGAALFGLNLYPETQSKTSQVEIGTQSGAPFVRFTLPLTYSGVVTFNASGLYNISDSTMLKIVNQTGTIEYFQQVSVFPIQTRLFNSTGEYVATFESLKTTNSTILTVVTEVTTTQQIYPYNYLLFVGSLMAFAGTIFFPASASYSLLNNLKAENNPEKRFFRVDSSTIFHAMMFSFFVVFFQIFIVILPNLALGNTLFGILMTAIITILTLFSYLRTISFVSKVDVKSEFKQIVFIQRIAELTNYVYYVVFFSSIPLIFLYFIGSFNFLLQILFLLIPLAIMDSFFSIFKMLTPQGNIIVSLSHFLEDFRIRGCSAEFKYIRQASKYLAEMVRPYNLMPTPASISSSLSYYTIVLKDTSKIAQIITAVEQSPADYKELLPLMESALDHSLYLESKGLKGLPSFFEKYSKHISIVVSVITVVIGIITIAERLI